MNARQAILPVILSFVTGGISGVGASRLVTEHRLTALETDVKHILEDGKDLKDDVREIKYLLLQDRKKK